MIKTILLPIDFSPCSLRAITPALYLARATNSAIILLNVVEVRSSVAAPFYFAIPAPVEYESDLHALSIAHLERISQTMREEGAKDVRNYSVSGTAYAEIVRFATEHAADLIIMGTHGASGFNEFFIGTNASRVVNKAACPVITIPERDEIDTFKNIILPVDAKGVGEAALFFTIWMSKISNATIHLLLIEGSVRFGDLPVRLIRGRLEEEGVPYYVMGITGSFLAKQVMKYANEQKSGLLVIEGHREGGFLTEYFTGPFTQQVVNHSKIPVLTIHPSDSFPESFRDEISAQERHR